MTFKFPTAVTIEEQIACCNHVVNIKVWFLKTRKLHLTSGGTAIMA